MALLLVACLHLSPVESLQIGKLFERFQPKVTIPTVVDGVLGPSPVAQTKQELLAVISNTGNGKDSDLETQKNVLQLVRYLETNAPVPKNLLEEPVASKALDGVFYLQYTQPSDLDTDDMEEWNPENSSEGDSNIDTRKVKIKGSVRAGGLNVDTSNRVTTQTIDVANQRVLNNVEQDFGFITVGGSFRVSDTVKTRAVVAFDTADIKFNSGFVLSLGFLFSIIAAFRGGIKDNGWLETTFLDDDMRIGRGNKGSLFILTRDKDAVQP